MIWEDLEQKSKPQTTAIPTLIGLGQVSIGTISRTIQKRVNINKKAMI